MKPMITYPKNFLRTLNKADHLLFDIGYSAALLWRVKEVLQSIVQGDKAADWKSVAQLLAAIKEFEANRLNVRSDIYDNAEAAAAKGFIDIKTKPNNQPK
jgi:hypothetical protein